MMFKKIKNFELKLYLDAWLYNVGYSSSPERTLMFAVRDEASMAEWFGKADDYEYDEEFALAYLRQAWAEDHKKE